LLVEKLGFKEVVNKALLSLIGLEKKLEEPVEQQVA